MALENIIIKSSVIDLLVNTNSTVDIGTFDATGYTKLDCQVYYDGCAATENTTEPIVRSALDKATFDDASVDAQTKITDGTTLDYVFATHGAEHVLTEIETAQSLGWISITLFVPSGAAQGTATVQVKLYN